MVDPQTEQSDWFEERSEDLVVTSIRVLQLNGRFLYLKVAPDLTEFNAGERRILGALAKQGDTVVVAIGPDLGNVRLSYRMPDLENAVAFDLDGLRGLIQQWSVWATATDS